MTDAQTTPPPVPDLRPWAASAAVVGRVTIAAIVVVNILNAYAIIAGPRENERYWYLLVTETSPSTWLSVTMLSGSALLAGVCWRVDIPRRQTFWALVMLSLLAMSLDDAAEVHERVGGNLADAMGDASDLSYLWVAPWAALAAVIGIILWRQRPLLPAAVRRWLLIGAGMSIGAAVVLEVVATKTVNPGGEGSVTKRLILYSVEENLEMIGVLIVAYTLARHALDVSEQARTSERADVV